MQMTLPGFERRTCQEPTAGVSASRARTSASQENRGDLEDSALACFFQLRTLLEDKRKKINPLTYSLKTLKIYLALTEGSILHGSSWSWTKSGMMRSGRFSTLPMSSLKAGKESLLLDILEDDVPEKYFLSEQIVKRLIIPTLNTGTGWIEPKVFVREGTRKGYAEAHVGDSINFAFPSSKTKRGRVGKKIAHTLDTGCAQAVIDPKSNRLRKLTHCECFRLQGFPDEYFECARAVCSDTQLYKQAGNSVTVPVVYEIAKRMEIGV